MFLVTSQSVREKNRRMETDRQRQREAAVTDGESMMLMMVMFGVISRHMSTAGLRWAAMLHIQCDATAKYKRRQRVEVS